MKIFPAIDIKDKKCVRLVKGDFDKKTEYKMSPVDQAGKYKDHGFKNLHIVDLDGALTGETVNLDIIKEIVTKFDLKIEVGGGIRTIDSIKKYNDVGAPTSLYFLILSIVLIPPPTSILRSNLVTISLMISKLTVSPVKAPSKSTICKFLKPWSLYLPAWSTGDILYSVFLSKSPLTNLTHFLSLMSIAGNIFILNTVYKFHLFWFCSLFLYLL